MVNKDDKSEKKEPTSSRATIIVAIIGAIATVAGAWLGSESKENQIINQISVVVNSGETAASDSLDLDVFLDEYSSLKSKNEVVEGDNKEIGEKNKELNTELAEVKASLRQRENELAEEKSKLSAKEAEYEKLKAENDKLAAENTKIKDILLQDNTYVDNLDDLVKVKKTNKRLSDIFLIDSDQYRVVEAIVDSHGNPHTYAYEYNTEDTAFSRYKLNGEYDVFSAYAVTGQDTTRDAVFCIEIWVDQERVERYDNLTTAEESYKIGPVSVRNADELKIIVARVAGYNYEPLFVTEELLSVVE